LAEMMLPDAVDDDAGGERIVFAGDGVGKIEPATAVRERRALIAGEDGHHAPRSFLTQHVRIAADVHAHRRRAAFLDGVDEWPLVGWLLVLVLGRIARQGLALLAGLERHL